MGLVKKKKDDLATITQGKTEREKRWGGGEGKKKKKKTRSATQIMP